MKIKMKLLSDTILGNGQSIPGAEDISILYDAHGFPYYKASSLKGIFREELINYLIWIGKNEVEVNRMVSNMLGASGDRVESNEKIRFSDFTLSEKVRNMMDNQNLTPEEVLSSFSYLRTFTALDNNGMVRDGSLRNARCLSEGIIFYGEIECNKNQEDLIKEILGLIKRVGTMRNRGFGQVSFEEC